MHHDENVAVDGDPGRVAREGMAIAGDELVVLVVGFPLAQEQISVHAGEAGDDTAGEQQSVPGHGHPQFHESVPTETRESTRIAIEVGTHSPWVSRALEE